MHGWQDRVIQEKLDLDMKLAKLEAFLHSDDYLSLNPIDRELLRRQASYMLAYSATLAQRIERFDLPDATLDEAP